MVDLLNKKQDLLLNVINNPTASVADMEAVGLNLNTMSFESKDTYRNNKKIQDLFTDKDGKFNELAFNLAYSMSLKAYNDLSSEDHNKNALRSLTYHRNNFLMPEEQRRTGPDFTFKSTVNPLKLTESIIKLGQKEAPKKTVAEIALGLKVFDPATGEWHDAPEDSFFTDFFDTRVLAEYTKEEQEKNQDEIFKAILEGRAFKDVTGRIYKLNDEGLPYYENLNGRDVYGRQVLNKFDILTREDSALNKYDFFDSDGKDKSILGSISKNAVLVGGMFIPYVGPVMAGLSVLGQGIGLLGTLGKMASINDPFFSLLEGFSKSVSREGKSEYALNHMWSMENMIGLIGDVAGQLKEQRWLFEYGPALIKGPKALTWKGGLKTDKMLEDLTRNFEKNSKFASILKKSEGVDKILGLKKMEIAKTFMPQGELEKWMKDYQKIGEHLSKIYMTGITVNDTYGEAKLNGASDLEALALTLGYAAGEYAIINSGLGEWILPELRADKYRSRAIAKVLTEKGTALKTPAKAATKAEKASWFSKLMKKGKDIATAEYATGEKTLKAALAGAAGESVEEVSEEFLQDMAYSCFNFVNWMRGDDTRMLAWEDMGNRYLMSAVGGAVGGGLTHLGTSYSQMKHLNSLNYNQAWQELVYMHRNGEIKDFLETVDKMELGDKNVSYTRDEDGQYLPADKDKPSLDEVAKASIKKQVKFLSLVLEANNASYSDEEILDATLVKELKYAELANLWTEANKEGSVTADAILQDFNNHASALLQLSLEQEVQANEGSDKTDSEKAKENKDKGGAKKDSNSADELAKEANIKLTKEKIKKHADALKSIMEGENNYDYIKDFLFEATHRFDSLIPATEVRYVQWKTGKNPAELGQEDRKQLHIEYINWRNGSRRDIIHSMAQLRTDIDRLAKVTLENNQTKYIEDAKNPIMLEINQFLNNLFRIPPTEDAEEYLASVQGLMKQANASGIFTSLLKAGGTLADVDRVLADVARFDEETPAPNREDYKLDDGTEDVKGYNKAVELNNYKVARNNFLVLLGVFDSIKNVVNSYVKRGYINSDTKQSIVKLTDNMNNIRRSLRHLLDTYDEITENYEKPYQLLELFKQYMKQSLDIHAKDYDELAKYKEATPLLTMLKGIDAANSELEVMNAIMNNITAVLQSSFVQLPSEVNPDTGVEEEQEPLSFRLNPVAEGYLFDTEYGLPTLGYTYDDFTKTIKPTEGVSPISQRLDLIATILENSGTASTLSGPESISSGFELFATENLQRSEKQKDWDVTEVLDVDDKARENFVAKAKKKKQEVLDFIDSLDNLRVLLDGLNHTDIESDLDLFALAIGREAVFTKTLKNINDGLFLNRNSLSEYSMEKELMDDIDEGLWLIDAYADAILSARTDNATAANPWGYNVTLNSVASNMGITPEFAEIDSQVADVFLLDLYNYRRKLNYAKKLYSVNSGLKILTLNKSGLNKNYIFFQKLSSWAVNIPDQWEGKALLLQAIQEADVTRKAISGETKNFSLTEEEKDAVFTENMKIDIALNNLFNNPKNASLLTADKLADLFDKDKTQIIETRETMLNLDTKDSDIPLSKFIDYIASRASVKASQFYYELSETILTEKKDKDDKIIAPVPPQEEAVYLNYAALANRKMVNTFMKAKEVLIDRVAESITDEELVALSKTPGYEIFLALDGIEPSDENFKKYKDLILSMLKLESCAPMYEDIVLTEGLPGSGKSQGVMRLTAKMLLKFHPELIGDNGVNADVVHTSDEAAKQFANSIGLSKANGYDIDGLLNKYFVNYVKPEIIGGKSIIPKSEYLVSNDKRIVSTLEFKQGITPAKVIIIDEVSRLNHMQLLALVKLKNEYGTVILTSGDFDQTGLEGTIDLAKDGKYVISASRGNFFGGLKLGVSMRTACVLKTLNTNRMQAFMLDPTQDELVFDYLEDETGLYGDKVISAEGDELTDTEVDEIVESIRKMIKTSFDKDGNYLLVNYIFHNKNSKLYKKLFVDLKEEFSGKIKEWEGNSALGFEGKYWIVENNRYPTTGGRFDEEVYLKELYTGITRSEQGCIIIAPKIKTGKAYGRIRSISSRINKLKLLEGYSEDLLIKQAKSRKDQIQRALKILKDSNVITSTSETVEFKQSNEKKESKDTTKEANTDDYAEGLPISEEIKTLQTELLQIEKDLDAKATDEEVEQDPLYYSILSVDGDKITILNEDEEEEICTKDELIDKINDEKYRILLDSGTEIIPVSGTDLLTEEAKKEELKIVNEKFNRDPEVVDEGDKPIEYATFSYSSLCNELGVIVGSDGKIEMSGKRPTSDPDDMRIDGINGLLRLGKLKVSNKIPNSSYVSAYLPILNEVRALLLDVKDKGLLIQKILDVLGIDNLSITFGYKITSRFEEEDSNERHHRVANKYFRKADKTLEEKILNDTGNDERSAEVSTKSFVAIITSEKGDILEIPLAKLSNPLSLMNSTTKLGENDPFKELNEFWSRLPKNMGFRDKALALIELFKGNDKYLHILNHFRLFVNNVSNMFYFDDSVVEDSLNWTFAQAFENCGPQYLSLAGFERYDVDGFKFNRDDPKNKETAYLNIADFRNERQGILGVSRVLMCKNVVGGFSLFHGVKSEDIQKGHPFVLVTSSPELLKGNDMATSKAIENYYLKLLKDPELEKKVRVIHVLKPNVSLREYIQNVKGFVKDLQNEPLIGNVLTTYRILKTLFEHKDEIADLFNPEQKALYTRAEASIMRLVKKVEEKLLPDLLPDTLNAKQLDILISELRRPANWFKYGGIGTAIPRNLLYNNVLIQLAYDSEMLGLNLETEGLNIVKPKIEYNESKMAKIEEIIQKYNPTLGRVYMDKLPILEENGMVYFEDFAQNDNEMLPFQIHGKVDMPMYTMRSTAMNSIIEGMLNKLEDDDKEVSKDNKRYFESTKKYKHGNSNLEAINSGKPVNNNSENEDPIDKVLDAIDAKINEFTEKGIHLAMLSTGDDAITKATKALNYLYSIALIRQDIQAVSVKNLSKELLARVDALLLEMDNSYRDLRSVEEKFLTTKGWWFHLDVTGVIDLNKLSGELKEVSFSSDDRTTVTATYSLGENVTIVRELKIDKENSSINQISERKITRLDGAPLIFNVESFLEQLIKDKELSSAFEYYYGEAFYTSATEVLNDLANYNAENMFLDTFMEVLYSSNDSTYPHTEVLKLALMPFYNQNYSENLLVSAETGETIEETTDNCVLILKINLKT